MNRLIVDIRRRLPGFTLSVQLEAGEGRLGLLGASGSGKSMTLRCIAGVDDPDEGVIVLNGRTLFDSKKKLRLTPQKRRAGYLFQNYALFPHMTVAQNILTPLNRVSRKERKEILSRYAALFQLEGLMDRLPGELSGGQQQRAALARALCWRPDILMLDEPFSALDSYLSWQLEPSLLELLEGYGGITLFVSHNRDEAYRFCSELMVMDQGRIVAAGSKEEVFLRPQCLAAARLTGCKNISRAERTGAHALYAKEWGMALKTAAPVPPDIRYVGLRAHDFCICGPEDENAVPLAGAQVSETPFSVTVMIPGRGREPLRWEIDRSQWPLCAPSGLPPFASLPRDKLMLLQ